MPSGGVLSKSCGCGWRDLVHVMATIEYTGGEPVVIMKRMED